MSCNESKRRWKPTGAISTQPSTANEAVTAGCSSAGRGPHAWDEQDSRTAKEESMKVEQDPNLSLAAAQVVASYQQRRERGRAARRVAPRGGHAEWAPAPDRPDPVDLLETQARDRIQELMPIRYSRMMASPFAFMRGSAIIMANDFDATDCREAARASAASYRRRMAEFSEMGELEVWYTRVGAEEVSGLLTDAKKKTTKKVNKAVRKARGRDSLQALSKLTRVVDGRRMIIDDPPLLVRIPEEDDIRTQVYAILESYKRTLQDDRRHLLERYRFVDAARKVVGVGSVGTRAYVVLLEGRDENDPLFLQVKEAGTSVLENYVKSNTYEHHGHRVVAGQRLMQAASDIFLGWFRGTGGRDFYWRQLRDMKGSANVEGMSSEELVLYGKLCGWTLARAHARSGDRVHIAAYLGKSERFDRAIAEFAQAYADQTERDHAALCAAVNSGRLPAAADA